MHLIKHLFTGIVKLSQLNAIDRIRSRNGEKRETAKMGIFIDDDTHFERIVLSDRSALVVMGQN